MARKTFILLTWKSLYICSVTLTTLWEPTTLHLLTRLILRIFWKMGSNTGKYHSVSLCTGWDWGIPLSMIYSKNTSLWLRKPHWCLSLFWTYRLQKSNESKIRFPIEHCLLGFMSVVLKLIFGSFYKFTRTRTFR